MTCQRDEHDRLLQMSRGELSGPEADSLLRHVFGCSSCREDFELLADMSIVPAPDGTRILPMLISREARGRSSWRRWAAAAAILLMTGSIWFLQGPRDVTRFAETTPLPFLEGRLRAEGAAAEVEFVDAMKQYQAGDYRSAARALGTLIEQHPGDDKLRVYQGISLLQLKEPRSCILTLEPATISEIPLVAERALWYSAMAWLTLDDEDAARAILETLRDRNGSYHFNAYELLTRLDGVER